MASDIRRFKWIMNPAGGSHLVDNPGGRWVRYEDHEKALAEAVRVSLDQRQRVNGQLTVALSEIDDLRRKLDKAVGAMKGAYDSLVETDDPEEACNMVSASIDIALREIESTEPQEDLGEPDEIAPGVVEKLRQLAENVVDIPVDLLDDDEDPCPKSTAVWERWEAYAKGESHNCEAPSTGMVRIAETFLDVVKQIQTIRDRLDAVDIPEVNDGR